MPVAVRTGLDVDGCDVSGDMLAYCQQAAEREGLAPRLYRQALHQLDLPRRYKTIFVCRVFGIGVSRAQDFIALERFYQHLEPGGMLLLEVYPPYRDSRLWPLWQKDARAHLPEAWSEYVGIPPTDDHEYELHYRLLVVDETFTLTSNHYFRNEMHLLLEKAGFSLEAEKGDWTDSDATGEHDVIVYFARK